MLDVKSTPVNKHIHKHNTSLALLIIEYRARQRPKKRYFISVKRRSCSQLVPHILAPPFGIKKLTINPRSPHQPHNPQHIPHKQHPTNPPTPTKDDMNQKRKRKQQTTLPRMKPHIIALVLQHQQQHASRRRQQQIRKTGLVVEAPAQTRGKHIDVFAGAAKAARRRCSTSSSSIPCYALNVWLFVVLV